MEIAFQFSSLSEFFNMNGHGIYVWVCYLITAAAFAFLGVGPRLKKRTFIRIQRAIFSRQHN